MHVIRLLVLIFYLYCCTCRCSHIYSDLIQTYTCREVANAKYSICISPAFVRIYLYELSYTVMLKSHVLNVPYYWQFISLCLCTQSLFWAYRLCPGFYITFNFKLKNILYNNEKLIEIKSKSELDLK